MLHPPCGRYVTERAVEYQAAKRLAILEKPRVEFNDSPTLYFCAFARGAAAVLALYPP